MGTSDLFLSFFTAAFMTVGATVASGAEIIIRTEDRKGFAQTIQDTSLVVSTNAEKDVTAQDLLAAARSDYVRITNAFYGRAYYGPIINILFDGREAASIPPLEAPKSVSKIIITVKPGPKFKFSRATAAPITAQTVLPKGYRQEKPAKSLVIEDAARAGILGWRNAGHAKVDIAEENFTVNHDNRTMAADIRFAPGPKLRFGNLIIKSKSKVKPYRVHEIAGLPEGEVYSPDAVKKSVDRLRSTGAFRSVSLQEAEQPSADGTLDMELELVDEKKRRFGAGAEIYSQEGLKLSAFWMHRNLLGGAERLRFEGEIGGIGGNSGGVDYRISTRFERPATFDPDTDFFIVGELEDLDEPNYKQRNATIGAGVKHEFSDHLTGELGVGFRYSKINDDLGKRKTRHLLLPARLTWDWRNDEFNATNGHYVDAQAQPFFGVDDSAVGMRTVIDSRIYRSVLTRDRLVFAGRVQLGNVMASKVRNVPPDMLFFSGGAGTVRGQKYLTMGVELPNGDEVGGRSFVGLSGEARIKLKKTYGVGGFVDGGYVTEDAFGRGRDDWHGGAGLGFRYFTSIGPIRTDIATPLGKKAFERAEVYIGIGQAF